MTTPQRCALAGVIAIGVLARLGWAVHVHADDPAQTRYPDTYTYTEPARALIRDGVYETQPGSGVPAFIRTPGYPAYVAAVYAVTDESDVAILVGQIVLGGITMLLVFALLMRIGAPYRVALFGVLLVAFEPLQFAAAGQILTESIAGLCLTVVGYCAVRMVQTRFAIWCTVGFGVALTIATMVRPTTYYFPVLVAVLLVAYGLIRRPLRRRAFTAAAIVLVISALVLGGWQLRNHEQIGSWRLSGIEAINMYWYRAAGAIAEENGLSLDDAQRRLTWQLHKDLGLSPLQTRVSEAGTQPERSSGPYLDRAYSLGVDLLRKHPRGLLVITTEGLAREVGGVGSRFFFDYVGVKPVRPLLGLAWLALVLFYALVAIGVVGAARRRWGPRLSHALILGLVAYVLLVSAGPESNARFRAPVMPLLAAYAALGAATVWSRWANDAIPDDDDRSYASGGRERHGRPVRMFKCLVRAA